MPADRPDHEAGGAALGRFAEYYRAESLSEEAIARFRSIRDTVQGYLTSVGRQGETLDVADIGCGAGTQCIMWADDGHRVEGLDVNDTLIEIARSRAAQADREITFHVGTAEDLPWDDASIDVCLVPELLEHVSNWEGCLDEFARVLRPGGVIYLSTNNVFCPVQQEFDLPLYSWYPGFLKRRYERLATTTRPELVNHADFPAVNWFSFYGLRSALASRGMLARDRFDMMRLDSKGVLARLAVKSVRKLAPLRFLAHVLTPYTALIAVKAGTGMLTESA